MSETPNEAPAVNEWDESAEGWDGDEATRAYATAAFSSLVDVLEPRGISLAGANVVDFGCGTGLLTERLVAAGADVIGIDTSSAMLAVLEAKIAEHTWSNVATAATIPSSPGSFDLVVCSSVCAFLDDYPATVVELARLLKPGGLFVQWDWERVDEDPHGLSRAEITDALESAGLGGVAVDVGFEAEAHGQTMRPLMGIGQRTSDTPE